MSTTLTPVAVYKSTKQPLSDLHILSLAANISTTSCLHISTSASRKSHNPAIEEGK
jgi:hypothetical protein